MSIQSLPTIKTSTFNNIIKRNTKNTSPRKKYAALDLHTHIDAKQAIDCAKDLLQDIAIDKISGELIRTLSSEEYLHLLGLLDEIISGSIDKHI